MVLIGVGEISDWNEISLLWNNISLLISEDVGTTASLIGTILTVYFAIRAKSAASAARLASEETRSMVAKLDLLFELTEVKRLLDDVISKLNANSWEMVAERCSSIRSLLAPIMRSTDKGLGSESQEMLATMLAQVKSLGETATKCHHGTIQTPAMPRLVAIVEEQKEAIAVTISEAKRLIGSDNEQ